MSVVFNSFKQRFLNGEVPKEDNWKFVPVNKTFVDNFVNQADYALEQYRSSDDFSAHNPSAWNASKMDGVAVSYNWYKPIDTDELSKPMFITSGSDVSGKVENSNWEEFVKSNLYDAVKNNPDISSYLAAGGFYFIRKKDELRWFAQEVNDNNNRIIGVIGDNIEGVIRDQIGKDESYPFQGILDGNGFSLVNPVVICDNDDNGLVGVLGSDGIVKNFKITNQNNTLPSLVCQKQINIKHIKNDGRDINAAILVGRNYGTVQNINASELNDFTFSGFVPQVYSVTNKSDDYSNFTDVRNKFDNGDNFYYLNSWCINSPGNVCPYVGYFAEGLFAQSARMPSPSGGLMSTEVLPTIKSKYNMGVHQVNINFHDNCSDVAFYVKAHSDDRGIFSAGSPYLNDPMYCRTADTLYGTNAIWMTAYESVDENNVKSKVFFEINGLAWDEHSGQHKRRYHFHAGHWDYLSNGVGCTVATPSAMSGTDVSDWYTKLFSASNEENFYIRHKYVFQNGYSLEPENEKIEIQDNEYVVEESDVKAFAEDGTPAKINDIDTASLYFEARNYDTSSSVWNDGGKIEYNMKLTDRIKVSGIAPYSIGGEQKTGSFEFSFNPNGALARNINWVDVIRTNNNYTLHDETGGAMPAEAIVVFDMVYVNCAQQIYNLLNDVDYIRNRWLLNAPGTNNAYSTEIICDESDTKNFRTYFGKRGSTWVEDVTFKKFDNYDINTNSQRDKTGGSVEAALISVDEFQYRPFLHASKTDEIFVNPTIGDNNYKYGFYPGAKFTSLLKANKSRSDIIDYFANSAAPAYIKNPMYYGLDINGYWTTQCVRPVLEYKSTNPSANHNETWKSGLETTNAENWISTLNFNWNIMRKMFAVQDPTVKNMYEYDTLLDPEPYEALYNDSPFILANNETAYKSDIPHDLLNKSIRMNTMARAAYYISPIIGSNFGKVNSVVVKTSRQNTGNFVGFVGSIAGKQERGEILKCDVEIQDKFIFTPSETDFSFEDLANSGFAVAYKATPIVPPNIIPQASLIDPDSLPTSAWQFYPVSKTSMIDEDTWNTLTTDAEKNEYCKSLGITYYTATQISANPEYQFEQQRFEIARPLNAFTSAWFDEQLNAMTYDVNTFKLDPIFNAGGLFGKIVPTYNETTNGIKIQNVNVKYDIATDTAGCEIHNTFGSVAGLIELHTSEVGQASNSYNKINLTSLNAYGKNSVYDNKVNPFGFFAYQPNEIPSVAATQDSPRHKGGYWTGDATCTTYAIDLPIPIDWEFQNSKQRMEYAVHNQSNAAFFEFEKAMTEPSDYPGNIVPLLFASSDSKSNGDYLTYYNFNAFAIRKTDDRIFSVQSQFGSNLNVFDNQTVQEELNASANPRQFKISNFAVNDDDVFSPLAFEPTIQNLSALDNQAIFENAKQTDEYYDYSYTTTSAYHPNFIFEKRVIFNETNPDENGKTQMGYVFDSNMHFKADGFEYEGNYINLGQSVNPSVIRTQITENETFSTSGIFAGVNAAMEKSGTSGDFGGILVQDSAGRNIMFIDNTDGARLEGGSYNYRCKPVIFDDNNKTVSGGLLLEVK